MANCGYDISDHCAIDPFFGTMADMDQLIAASHDAGLKVMLDWVPNHTSDQHPWFVESRSSRTSPKRDWYVWRDGGGGPDGARPNNWVASSAARRGPGTTPPSSGTCTTSCQIGRASCRDSECQYV